jgi:type I restriction enzyme M protein
MTLSRLIEYLRTYDLDNDTVPADMLGEAYMDLVRHFAEEEGKSGDQFFTPPHIVQLMVRLIEPFEDGDTFHDPTVGSGGMLVESATHYRDEQGGDPSKLTFTGQEINPGIAAIAKMNLSIHGLSGRIEREDSLLRPPFTENGSLTRFDYVLANFPFSADWQKDELQDDTYSRFDWYEKLPRPIEATTLSSCTWPNSRRRPKRTARAARQRSSSRTAWESARTAWGSLPPSRRVTPRRPRRGYRRRSR